MSESQSLDDKVIPDSQPLELEIIPEWQRRRFHRALFLFYMLTGLIHSLPGMPSKQLLMIVYKIQPSTMAFVSGIIALPWIIKPMLGFCSDCFPIRGERRRPYIAFAMTCNTVVFFGLSYLTSTAAPIGFIILFLFLASISNVLADVAVNSLLIVNAKLESSTKSGFLQSTCWIWKAVGAVIGSATSGVALVHMTNAVQAMFIATAVCSLLGFLIIPFFLEKKVVPGLSDSVADKLEQLLRFGKQPDILRLAAFIVFLNGMPSTADTFLYWMKNRLGFDFGFLSNLSIVRHASHLATAIFFRERLLQVPIRSIVGFGILTNVLLGASTIIVVRRWNSLVGLPDHLFVLGDTLGAAVCKELILMPIIVLAAKISPDGAEGSIYSALFSIWSLSHIISNEIGGLLTLIMGIDSENYANMWILIAICSLAALLPLYGLRLLPHPSKVDYKLVQIPKVVPTDVVAEPDESSRLKQAPATSSLS